MTYVLVALGVAYAGFVHTQEFTSRERCEAALYFIQEKGNNYIKVGCFPK